MYTPSDDPTTRGVSTGEYLLWRVDPVAAHAARYGGPAPAAGGAPMSIDKRRLRLRALVNRQVFANLAAAFLRAPGHNGDVFGRDDPGSFMGRYRVPTHWYTRSDMALGASDDAVGTLVQFDPSVTPAASGGADSAAPEEDLWRLAYTRYTMRESGAATERVGVLSMTPTDDPDAASVIAPSLFQFRDLTALIDEPPAAGTASIADRVAREAVEVMEFLQDPGAVHHGFVPAAGTGGVSAAYAPPPSADVLNRASRRLGIGEF